MKQRIPVMTLAAALALAAPLVSQPIPAGPEVAVEEQRQDAFETAIAATADGGLLALWNTGHEILARALNPDGGARSPRALVREDRLDEGTMSPAVAALAGGGSVAVWFSTTSTDVNGTIFFHNALAFRLLDAAGQPAGPETVVAEEVWTAAVAAVPSGGFVLAWVGEPGSPLVARRFDAHGAALGGDIQVADFGRFASLAALPDGGFVVAWSNANLSLPIPPASLGYRIFAADGTPRTPAISFQTANLSDYGLWISADATGRFVIAWIDEISFNNRVRARRFGAGGEPLGPEIAVTPGEQAVERLVDGDVAMRSDGSFLVVWEKLSSNEILARAYGADGNPQGEPFLVHSLPGPHRRPDVAVTSRGWLVAWTAGGRPYVRSFVAADCGGPYALCLNANRFRVEATWRIPGSGPQGLGTPVPRTSDTGAFWFFQPSNYELLVKVLDGRGVNGHFWVFYGSLTNVEFDLTVTDTLTGQQRRYHNPAGTMASQADTTAF